MPRPAVGISRDRSVAAVAAIIIHVALIAALLNAIAKYETRRTDERETTLLLFPAQKKSGNGARTHSGRQGPQLNYAITLPPSVPPDVLGLGLSLLACTPENLPNLPVEARAKCEQVQPGLRYDATAMAIPNFQVTNRERWELELAIKQTPQLAPCASPSGGTMPDGGKLIEFDLICLGKVAINGYRPENVPHYSK